MGLYKRGKVWWMGLTYKNRQVRRSTETTDKKLAEKIHAKVITQIVEGNWFERPVGAETTLKELLEKYMREHSAKNKTLKSHNRDKSLASHLNRYFGDIYLTDITPKSISHYKVSRRKEGAAPKTVNNELGLLSHAYNLALKEWEWVDLNPVSRVSKEKVNNQRVCWLTIEEEERLLSSSPKWLKEIIIFALNTGLRQGEILDLSWDRVDLFRKTIIILVQKNKDIDTLPINTKVLKVLKARSKVRSIKTDFVFLNKAGTRIDASNLRRAFNSAKVKAGIKNLDFMTCVTPLQHGLYRLEWTSTKSRSL